MHLELPKPDWLDDEPAPALAPVARKRKRRSKQARKAQKRKAEKKVEVVSSWAIGQEAARKFGEGRVWGCDGHYIFFRPKRYIDGVWTQVANPAAMERHERFVRLGHYKYIGTTGDVQVFEVTENSPLKRKFGSLMELETGQLKRAVIMAAVKREWQVYVDALEELAIRIKSRRWSDGKSGGGLAADQWSEMLGYIELQIQMRRGPAPEECAREMQRVRIARNGGSEKRILLA